MKHILIVDDDKMNRLISEKALSQDYRISMAASGREALDFLEKEIPDLILMDIEMPDMNGKETVIQIKQNKKWDKIPIIFLTSDSDAETEIDCLKLGAEDFITKPFVPPVMRSRISKSLELIDLQRHLEKQLERKKQQIKAETKKAHTDMLTKLHNRLYLEQTMQKMEEKKEKGAMFMIDLDNFKIINDTYGHIVGDKTLQRFADVLRAFAKEGDIVCRLAGDEFVTFYPDLTNRETISTKAEGIIRLFAEKMGELGYGGVVSVSIGIVITEGEESFQNLYNKADKSLYFVKNNGKNAYHFYGKENDVPSEINTVIDLDNVYHMMEDGMDMSDGTFQLAYDEFKKIYDFVVRGMVRRKQDCQMVLFTIEPKQKILVDDVEDIMEALEQSISVSLRVADTGTKYSNSQYIVLLIDSDMENGKMVAKRVIDHFYQNSRFDRQEVSIRYNIRTIEPTKSITR